MATKAQARFQFPKQVEDARDRVEELAERTWDRAVGLIPADSRRALKKASKRVEKTADDLQKRSERYLKDVDKRRKKLTSDFEKRAFGAIRSVMDRLEIPSRTDLNKLSRRLSALEKKVDSVSRTRRQAA